jgi:hypothetical protein
LTKKYKVGDFLHIKYIDQNSYNYCVVKDVYQSYLYCLELSDCYDNYPFYFELYLEESEFADNKVFDKEEIEHCEDMLMRLNKLMIFS